MILEVVFFFYGLSFFVLGLTILVYPKRPSDFTLAGDLNLLAVFGLLHGVNEWLDMFILMEAGSGVAWLKIARMATLPVSFLFLVQFGVVGITRRHCKWAFLRTLPAVLMLAWLLAFAISSQRMLMGDVWARYLICVPGAVLTALALMSYRPDLKAPEHDKALAAVKWAAIVFVLYGVFAGLIVKNAGFWPSSVFNYRNFKAILGFPVQAIRAVCAAALAMLTMMMLRIFYWETRSCLRESDLRCKTVLKTFPMILFIEDADGRMSFVQGRGLEGTGRAAEQLLGRPSSELFPQLAPSCDAGSCLGADRTCECNVSLGDRVFQLCYSPMPDGEGGIGIALDVTARLKIEADLEQYRQQMVRTQRLTEVGTMGTAMASQIAEPLNVTRMLLERVISRAGESESTETVAASLNKAYSETTDVLAALDRFCDFAQISPPQHPRSLDLYQLGSKVVAAFAEQARQAGLTIALDHLDMVPAVFAAAKELEYIFFVLIQRAIERSDPKASQSLNIGCETSDDAVILRFADTCRPVCPVTIGRVFEPFADSMAADNGTGLGLAVIKQIVEAHKGSVNVAANTPEGMIISVTLPARA